LSANQCTGERPETLLSATVVRVADRPEVFGTTTRLWVDMPGDTLELTVPETDMLIARLEAFLPRLRAARQLLASASMDDRPENPAAVERYMTALHDRITARTVAVAA